MKTLAQIKKEVILQRLEENNGNRTRTAKSLGIGIRTLQRKLKSYGLPPLEAGDYNRKWNFATIAAAAGRFNSLSEWRASSPESYQAACSRGFLNDLKRMNRWEKTTNG